MIAILAAIGHWCASCIPASVGVAPTVGALSGAAAAAAGISGLGNLASDGGVGDAPDARVGVGSGADASASAASDPATGDTPAAPTEAQTAPDAQDPTTGPFHAPGWIDATLGLNPETSFVQAGMYGLGYGPGGIWGRPVAPGEGDLTTLGRALGAAAGVPLVAQAVVIGDALDNLNHGPELSQVGAEVGEQLNEAPTSPYPAPSDPPSTAPSNAQDAGQADATVTQPSNPQDEPTDPYVYAATQPSNPQDAGQTDATVHPR